MSTFVRNNFKFIESTLLLTVFFFSQRKYLGRIGYVQIRLGSDPLWYGSTVCTRPVLNRNGMVPHRITFISGPIWYQIADPIRTGSTRSRVNTRPIRTDSKWIRSCVNAALNVMFKPRKTSGLAFIPLQHN